MKMRKNDILLTILLIFVIISMCPKKYTFLNNMAS